MRKRHIVHLYTGNINLRGIKDVFSQFHPTHAPHSEYTSYVLEFLQCKIAGAMLRCMLFLVLLFFAFRFRKKKINHRD